MGTTHLVACACAYLDTLPESQEPRSESNEPRLQKARQSKLAIKQREDASWRDLDHLVPINAGAGQGKLRMEGIVETMQSL